MNKQNSAELVEALFVEFVDKREYSASSFYCAFMMATRLRDVGLLNATAAIRYVISEMLDYLGD